MSTSLLTNDTRTPPQAAILGVFILLVGLTAVLLVAKPWQQPSVGRSYWFWGAGLAVLFLSRLAGN